MRLFSVEDGILPIVLDLEAAVASCISQVYACAYNDREPTHSPPHSTRVISITRTIRALGNSIIEPSLIGFELRQ